MDAYFMNTYTYICGVSNSIIVGDLVCRAWLTHRGTGHRFLDDLSNWFTFLDESGTPSVWL